MLNETTAKSLAAEVCQDLGVDGPAKEAWEKVIKKIVLGIALNAVVTGTCPPNGGPLVQGKLT